MSLLPVISPSQDQIASRCIISRILNVLWIIARKRFFKGKTKARHMIPIQKKEKARDKISIDPKILEDLYKKLDNLQLKLPRVK